MTRMVKFMRVADFQHFDPARDVTSVQKLFSSSVRLTRRSDSPPVFWESYEIFFTISVV